MTLFALVLALVLEQFRPLNAAKLLYPLLDSLGEVFENRFNDGNARHGMIAWLLMVLPPVLLSAFIAFLLYHFAHPLAAFAFNVAVLYYTMGFRHVSHFFTRIHAALRSQDLPLARRLIGEWRMHLYEQSSSQEITRMTIEGGILGAHRQVFAIIVLFALLPGPSGAVLYRMSEYYNRSWGNSRGIGMEQFGSFARRAFAFIEWLPARITAMAFAIVGDFEDAIHCWRTQSDSWPDANDAVVLAAGAGALGVRLGQPINQSGEILERPELGVGDESEVEYLQSFVGLVRRTLVLYVMVLLMMGITRLLS
ncbi:CobD/CbiB family protein [Uliginosibacterium sediminicola]|uniref:Cobalamin biosynthesis protein CobD n=1 Tax=Uliginosibacterium sediminicola TaxID=2024550 RepID=A0ABU9Z2S4_9RHOO